MLATPIPRTHHRLALAAATAGFAACYAGIIAALIGIWSGNPLYSYGFLVPVISAYICWIKWQEGPAPASTPDYPFGVGVTLAGMAALLVGRLGSVSSLEFGSLVVTLIGLTLLLFGRESLKRYWFALAYLLLAVPVWTAAIDRLQEPSRLLSAGIATAALHALNIPVLQQGTNIVMPVHTLAVMRECSGVNQLVAMIAMVLPASYLWLSGTVRRAVLIPVAILITYLSNGFRIALVGWLAFHGVGDGNLLGSYTHLSEGLVVALIGYAAIGICFSLLSRSTRPSQSSEQSVPVASARGPSVPYRRVWLDAVVAVIMIAVGGSQLVAMSSDVSLNKSLQNLPSTIGAWTSLPFASAGGTTFSGISEELVDAYRTSNGEFRFEGADDELSRVYRDANGSEVRLYVGYFRRQEAGKELTGDAAHELRLTYVPLSIDSVPPATIGEVARTTGSVKRGVLFWYDVEGRIASNVYMAKVYTIWNALARHRTDGAVIMIAWDGIAGAQADAARAQAIAFAKALMPILRGHLPS